MSIAVACPCGASYELKDEFAGRSLQCPKCGQVVKAGTTAIPSYENAAFERNKFLLRQKRVSINEKYHVWNEEGKPILFIERPAHLGRMLLAFIAGLVLFVVIGALAAAACFALSSRGHFTPLSAVVLILGLAIAAAAGVRKKTAVPNTDPMASIAAIACLGWAVVRALADGLAYRLDDVPFYALGEKNNAPEDHQSSQQSQKWALGGVRPDCRHQPRPQRDEHDSSCLHKILAIRCGVQCLYGAQFVAP